MFYIQNSISIKSPLNYVIWSALSTIFHERECLSQSLFTLDLPIM